MIAHLAGLAFTIAVTATILGLAITAACTRVEQDTDPRIPADVDLAQCVATTTAITDAGPQQYRDGRARGYARGRV